MQQVICLLLVVYSVNLFYSLRYLILKLNCASIQFLFVMDLNKKYSIRSYSIKSPFIRLLRVCQCTEGVLPFKRYIFSLIINLVHCLVSTVTIITMQPIYVIMHLSTYNSLILLSKCKLILNFFIIHSFFKPKVGT